MVNLRLLVGLLVLLIAVAAVYYIFLAPPESRPSFLARGPRATSHELPPLPPGEQLPGRENPPAPPG